MKYFMLIETLVIAFLIAGKVVAQSEIKTNFEVKQCNADIIALRVDPEPIQEAVGDKFSLLLDEGKAMVAIWVLDCEQDWIDGENLGTNHHVVVLARIEGSADVRPVIGAAQTEPTMTWFSLFHGSTNPRDQEARKASGTPEQIENVSLDPLGSTRGGRVTLGPDLNFTWSASMAEPAPRLVGYNHDIYQRGETGNIVFKRIQTLVKLTAIPSRGILKVQGNDALAGVIGAGQYPAMVYMLFPIWSRGNLGEDLSNTAENNRVAILKYIEEMNKGNEAYLDEYFGPGYTYHGSMGDMDLAAFKEFHHQVLNAFPDLVMSAEDIISIGDKVITRWKMHGSHKGRFLEIEATGKEITITGIIISRFENGKVVEEWEEASIASLMQQLGTMEAPAKE